MSTPSSVAAGSVVVDNTFIELPRFPSACTGLMNRLSDLYWERRFKLQTAGHRDARFEDAVHYEPLPYYAVFKVLERLRLTPKDVVVDIGSGMGRAVCVAAAQPIAAALGVEIEPELHAIAESNARNMRGRRAEIRLRCESATEFDYDAATVLWIFNPFGAATMRTVLARVEASWRARPRPLRIAYINATCAHVLAAQPWLQLEDAWQMSAWSRVKTPVQFYRSR
jgi:SAM-dependent methyltransferase